MTGKNGEVKNDSGDKLLRFGAVNDMLVMNSWFGRGVLCRHGYLTFILME